MNRTEQIRRAQADIASMTAPDLPVLPPIVGADIWEQVIIRADGQCECEECAARKHRKADGRCWATSTPGRPLHAVPRDDPSGISPMMPGADQLLALCDDCHAAAQARVRRARQDAAKQAMRDAPVLFEMAADDP
jgi:hypothetical protein